MTASSAILNDIEKAVLSQDPDSVDAIFQEAAVADLDADLLLGALTKGLDEARKQLGDMTTSVGDFLLSVDAVRCGLSHLKERMVPNDGKQKRAVLGVAPGEVHNLGIYIISGVMEALGYDVICLEQDTDTDVFINELKRMDASILGVSSMMTTTLAGMQDIIVRCNRELPDVKILVGGACMDEKMATSMGADGFAESAVDLPGSLDKLDSQGTYKRRYMDYDKKVQVTEY